MDRSHGKYMTVLYTKRADCGGACLYCIREPEFTHSTVENEDTRLARDTQWSSVAQFVKRVEAADLTLGTGLKFELRIKGNSFTNYDPAYLESYIKGVYDTLNGFEASTFEEAFVAQASAPDRVVQIVVETRPDLIDDEWCERMVHWGVTTVELGVQALSDELLRTNRRGHGVHEVIEASSRVRKHGFELGYHVMVGLIGSTREQDRKLLAADLWGSDFHPDTLKIYPCLATSNEKSQPGLYRAMRQGTWVPYSDREYLGLLRDVVEHFPEDVHVNRVQRIMAEGQIKHGPSAPIDRSIHDGMSRCMWQRSFHQAGLDRDGDYSDNSIKVHKRGEETCLQAVTPDGALLGYARLSSRGRESVWRDLRVLGKPLRVGEANTGDGGPQHIGVGKKLLETGHKLAVLDGCREVRVAPSAGTWEYFLNHGFEPVSQRKQRATLPEGT